MKDSARFPRTRWDRPGLSVAAQLRALRDYAKANGYVVAREYEDEAESGRVADRPQFRAMIEEGSKPNAPFQEILVWKFSRFTRKREHAVAFKSMLRRKGIRVVSITEHADDTATGRLMEAIIESVDEFYSENLAQEVTRGMREAASRGLLPRLQGPLRLHPRQVSDGGKERPTLEVDPAAAPIVREIFESSLRGNGLKEICKALNDRGITNRGARWYKGGLHYLLTNEAYTGTAHHREISGYVANFREFLNEGPFLERKALIRNFIKGIEVRGRSGADLHHPHAHRRHDQRGGLGSRFRPARPTNPREIEHIQRRHTRLPAVSSVYV